jgi:hypothetical protein
LQLSYISLWLIYWLSLVRLVETDQRFRSSYCLDYQDLVRWPVFTTLHSTVSQKAVIFILPTVWTWNLTFTETLLVLQRNVLDLFKWMPVKCFSTVPLKSTNISYFSISVEFPYRSVLDHFMSKLYHRWKTLVFILVPLQIIVLLQLSAVEPYFSFKFTQPQLSWMLTNTVLRVDMIISSVLKNHHVHHCSKYKRK